MPVITAITPQKKDATRCNIELDGRFFCGMKLETVMQNRLKAGAEVTAEELSRMQLESEKQTALDKALTHISASMKTEKEVRAYLARKGYLEEVTDYAVSRMKEYGYLDDKEYARRYCESAGGKKGRRLLALELKKRGVSEEDSEEALSGLGDEEEGAKAALMKYLRGKPCDRATLSKAFRHLLSKGYDVDTARAALAEWTDEDRVD